MKLADSYPVRLLCRLLGVPRSSVYYKPRPEIDEAMIKTALLDLAAEWPTYGYRRLTVMMQRDGWPVNSKRIRRFMDELNLTGAPPARKTRTTNSQHDLPLLHLAPLSIHLGNVQEMLRAIPDELSKATANEIAKYFSERLNDAW